MKGRTRMIIALGACSVIAACGGGGNNGKQGGQATATLVPTEDNTPGSNPTSTPQPGNPTPTVTPQSGNPTPTVTQTPGGGLTGEAAVQAFASSILGAISRIGDAVGGAVLPGPTTVPCTGGGTTTISCAANGTGSQSTYEFEDCRNSGGGGDIFLDGTIVQTTAAACFMPIPANSTFILDIDATLDTTFDGNRVAGTFDLAEEVVLRDGSSLVVINGTGEVEDCVGAFEIETDEPLVVPDDADCATAGEIRIALSGQVSIITATEDGGVDLDYDADGSVDDSFDQCTDGDLEECG